MAFSTNTTFLKHSIIKPLGLAVIMITLFSIFPVDSVLAADADSWRKVRQGIDGYTAVTGQEANVLIQAKGQEWRLLRNKLVQPYAAWSLALTFLALGSFFLLRGQVKLVKSRTGISVPRWSRA